MNKRSLALTVAASAALALGVRVFVFPHRAEPAEHLVALQARSQEPGLDPALMVREITRVLADPRTAEDVETHAALLWLRARVHADARHYPSARADLEQHAVVLGEATTAVVLRTAELEALEGRTMDAYTRVTRLLDADEDLHDGWRLAGRLERQLAQESRGEALETVDVLLVRSRRERSREVLEELCAREAEDPRRLQLASELAGLYLPSSPDPLAQALDLASSAADYNAAARASLARSLAGGPDGPTVTALIELLHEAGQPELAVELGMAAYSEGSEPASVFESLLDAMLAAGQIDRFAERVRTFPWRPTDISPELCLRALGQLVESGSWKDSRGRFSMSGPVRGLRALGRPDTESALHLYTGFSGYAAAVNIGDEERARVQFEKAKAGFDRYFTSSSRLDPFPGAAAAAHLYRSHAWRALGDERREREDLGRALTPSLDVDAEDWLSHASGEDFLRHAELLLKLPQRGSRRPEEDWTRGMARLPQQAYDLVERWEEIGQASLAETGHDIDRLFTNMRSAGSVSPAVDVGPWTRWKLARMLMERRNVQGAVVAARRLLDSYPGLILAYDLLIEAQLERGSRIQVIDDILERVAIVGPDARHARYVAEVGLDSFEPSQLLRAMQLDPLGIGRSVVAPRMMSAGEPARALAALGAPDAEEPPTTRLLRARAFEELGRDEAAEAYYTSLLAVPDLRDVALEALVRFRMVSPGTESLEAVHELMLQRLAEDELPPTDLALEWIDRETERGSREAARAVLEQLDARAVTRNGDVLWRIAIDRLLSGRQEEALEAFSRAEAYLDDERVALARLVIAIESREWRSIAPLAAAVRRAKVGPSPLVEAILAILEERTEAGRDLALAGMTAEPKRAEWLLVQAAAQSLLDAPFLVPAYYDRGDAAPLNRILRGTEHILRDPRQVLGILLLLELPDTDAWIEDALQRLDPESEELWTRYLRARAAARSERWPLAEFHWRRLTKKERRFGPGWTGLLETTRALHADPLDEAVLRVRVDRARALNRIPGHSELEEAVDEAAAHLLEGERELAIEVLAPVLAGTDGRATDARVLLARTCASLGRYAQADAAVSKLLPDARTSADGYWIAEYVQWLVAGTRSAVEGSQRIGAKKALSRLALLEERFPNDPLFTLERARMSVNDIANSAQAVGITLRLLDAFRERSRDLAFDRFRRGSSSAWGEFLLGLSPREAEEFLLNELAHAPGQLDLWSLLAEALEEQGRAEDAIELRTSIVQMSNDPVATHALAWALVRSGAPAGQVHAVLDQIPENEDPYGADRGRFLRALAQLQDARANLDSAGEILASLWENVDGSPGVDRALLGRSYAGVLLRQSSPEDPGELRRVLDELKRLPVGPYARTVLESYRGLAAYRNTPEGRRRPAPETRRGQNRDEDPEGAAEDDGEAVDDRASAPAPRNPRNPRGRRNDAGTDEESRARNRNRNSNRQRGEEAPAEERGQDRPGKRNAKPNEGGNAKPREGRNAKPREGRNAKNREKEEPVEDPAEAESTTGEGASERARAGTRSSGDPPSEAEPGEGSGR